MTDDRGGAGQGVGSGAIRETRVAVRRTARVAVLPGPATGGPPGGRGLWIGLHGYRQLARRFLRPLRGHVPPGVVALAPEGASRFYLEGTPGPHRGGDPVGASWMTREDREQEISDYTAALDDVLEAALRGGLEGVGPTRRPDVLGVLGFSQGVHTAVRWVAGSRVLPRLVAGMDGRSPSFRLVLWGASLPEDVPGSGLGALRDLLAPSSGQVEIVRGETDELRDPGGEAREEARLAEAGVPWRVWHHPGGHRVDGALAARLLGGAEKPTGFS